MKKALISKLEQVETGLRIAQVSTAVFETTPHFFWVECDDAVTTENYFYDPASKKILNIALMTITETIEKGFLSPKTFMDWITEQEKMAIANMMPTDPKIHEILDPIFSSTSKIRLSDPKFISDMEYFVSTGLISEARKNELLALG